jgi:hypothetical protein
MAAVRANTMQITTQNKTMSGGCPCVAAKSATKAKGKANTECGSTTSSLKVLSFLNTDHPSDECGRVYTQTGLSKNLKNKWAKRGFDQNNTVVILVDTRITPTASKKYFDIQSPMNLNTSGAIAS